MIESHTERNKTRAVVIKSASSAGAKRARRKFLRFFPGGFYDETYIDWVQRGSETIRYRSL